MRLSEWGNMKVIIAGTRTFNDYQLLCNTIKELNIKPVIDKYIETFMYEVNNIRRYLYEYIYEECRR